MEKENQNLIERPPVVVVMGHVDHGKTTLLDYIRKTRVAEKEAGGITQHIGAYEVEHKGKKITFIDTPGHEAFSKMRSRGARVADVAILVVAADESVKPQTKEALSHIQEAKTPFVVAITKIDKPGANPDKVKQDLAKEGVLVEGWGGKVPIAQVSSKSGEGVSDLLDLILLVAELEELRGSAELPGKGVVIESHLDPRRGLTATLLVFDGTLRQGDTFAAGSAAGKVKNLENFLGEKVEAATFSSPVVVLGWGALPRVGDEFAVGRMPEVVEKKAAKAREVVGGEGGEATMPEFTLILKADVSGSLEALEGSIKELAERMGVKIKVLEASVGNITETDAKLSDAGRAVIVGFRSRAAREVANFIEAHRLRAVTSDIIYELLEALEKEFAQWMQKIAESTLAGRLEVLGIFSAKGGSASGGKPAGSKQVVGGRVLEGKLVKGRQCGIVRKGAKIAEGTITNLQMNKKDVDDVPEGNECGILMDAPVTIVKGDVLEQTGV